MAHPASLLICEKCAFISPIFNQYVMEKIMLYKRHNQRYHKAWLRSIMIKYSTNIFSVYLLKFCKKVVEQSLIFVSISQTINSETSRQHNSCVAKTDVIQHYILWHYYECVWSTILQKVLMFYKKVLFTEVVELKGWQ